MKKLKLFLKKISIRFPGMTGWALKIFRKHQKLKIREFDYKNAEAEKEKYLKFLQEKTQANRDEKPSWDLKNKRKFCIDVTNLSLEDSKTGIQRVCREFVTESQKLLSASQEWEVIPVYALEDSFYLFECREEKGRIIRGDRCPENIVDLSSGDILLMPDNNCLNIYIRKAVIKGYIESGVRVYTFLHDIIPVYFKDYFSKDYVSAFELFLRTIVDFSGVITVSRATLNSFRTWIKDNNLTVFRDYLMEVSYPGQDIKSPDNAALLTEAEEKALKKLSGRPTFLCVGTVEPRKMHTQIFEAFKLLWAKGYDVNLVFVGKYGWRMEKEASVFFKEERKSDRFFWFTKASDRLLTELYQEADAVIQASLEEGFGLPIIEAAKFEKPVILRDIPVFREIIPDSEFYFSGLEGKDLAAVTEKFLIYKEAGKDLTKLSLDTGLCDINLTWKESVENLLGILKIR